MHCCCGGARAFQYSICNFRWDEPNKCDVRGRTSRSSRKTKQASGAHSNQSELLSLTCRLQLEFHHASTGTETANYSTLKVGKNCTQTRFGPQSAHSGKNTTFLKKKQHMILKCQPPQKKIPRFSGRSIIRFSSVSPPRKKCHVSQEEASYDSRVSAPPEKSATFLRKKHHMILECQPPQKKVPRFSGRSIV